MSPARVSGAARSALVIALLMVAVGLAVGLGVAVFWLARPGVEPAILQEAVRRDPDSAEALLQTLAGHLVVPFRRGNRIELLRDGEEIFPAMEAAVRGAEDSVEFLTYYFRPGRVTDRFIDTLLAAVERGVTVRFLVDVMGSIGTGRELARLRAGGVRVARFHAPRGLSVDRLNQRTHRKVLVVDWRVGYVGGVGISDEWVPRPRGAGWREDQFRIEGPAVADLLGAFAENWRQATGEVLSLAPPSTTADGDAFMVPLLDRPGGAVSHFRLAVWLLLHTARRRVRLRSPYFLPGRPLTEALIGAAARGVEVQLLVPGDANDSALVRLASRARYREFLEAGIQIWEYRDTMMHAKGVIADGRVALVGSHNLDYRSLRLNFEFGFAVASGPLLAAMEAAFDEDLDRAVRVDEAMLRGLGPPQRVGGWLARRLERFL